MKKAIEVSYDLGIEGDYQGLYQEPDTNKAIEAVIALLSLSNSS